MDRERHATMHYLGWRVAALIAVVAAIGAVCAKSRARVQSSLGLVVPVVGVESNDLVDSFRDSRDTDRLHHAIDIPAPRGTPVVAAATGRVQSILSSSRGGLGVYQTDATGTWCFYYAHLDGYANGLEERLHLDAGDPIGYVGTTGNAPENVPHLHFEVLSLKETTRCSDGRPTNPIGLFR